MRCWSCKRDLPESAFGHKKHNKSGLDTLCKECNRKRVAKYRQEVKELEEKDIMEQYRVVGGLKMTVLNYAKKGEHKYHIEVVGDGLSWDTNSKDEFLKVLNRFLK